MFNFVFSLLIVQNIMKYLSNMLKYVSLSLKKSYLNVVVFLCYVCKLPFSTWLEEV